MTTEEVKEYLSSYRNCLIEIRRLQQEQEEIRSIATSCGGAVGGGGNEVSDKVGKLAGRLADLDSIIVAEMDKAITRRGEVKNTISQIEDELLRLILEYKYINGMSLGLISTKINYSYKQTKRLHKKALEKIKMSLNVPIEV